MAEGVKVEIVSPERLVLSETVRSVTVPGTDGYFTVLGPHAPLMSTLRPGYVSVTLETGEEQKFFVAGGFADVSDEGLTLLAEEAIPANEFGRSEIEAQISKLEDELKAADTPEAQAAAQNRLDQWKAALLEAA